MAYADTSVLVAYYCPEAVSRSAQSALQKGGRHTIGPLTEVEFCSALSLKTRTKEMELNAANRVLALFRRHCAEGFYNIVPTESGQFEQACNWIAAFSTPLRTVDALHLAAAFVHGLALLTADRSLARSAKILNVRYKLIS